MPKENERGRITPEERAQADFEKKKRYWTSIITIRNNTQATLARGHRIIKPGHGYKDLNLRPDHADAIIVPLSTCQ